MQKNKLSNRLSIPSYGNFSIFTKGNLKISKGYEQIVFDKIPLVEILPKSIMMENLMIPFHQRWRQKSEKSDIIEYRSTDYCKIKIIFQKKTNRFYVSVRDIKSIQYPSFIKESNRKK